MPPKPKIEPEYADAYASWQAEVTPQTSGALLRAVDPITSAGLRAYAPKASPAARSRAKRIVLDALPAYDATYGPLKPHLMSRLQGLRRFSGQDGTLIRVPERVSTDRLRLDEISAELEDDLGRAPSDAELTTRAGFSRNRLATLRKAVKPLAEGRFAGGGDEGQETGLPRARLPGDDQGENEWAEMVYSSVSPGDQVVMERLLGLHGRRPETPGQVAASLKVTTSAVSQRIARIRKLLDRRAELSIL